MPPRSWAEFFEQAGLNSSVSQQYGAVFEQDKRDLDSSFLLFRDDNMDELKVLGMKSGHIVKVQKFVRGTKSGSLGGRRTQKGSFRMAKSTNDF